MTPAPTPRAGAVGHTPGPWTYSERNGKRFHEGRDILGADGATIARTDRGWAEDLDLANARLIASAPSLLELAEAFVAYLEDDSRSERRRAACLADARAALASARAEAGKGAK